MPSSPRTHTRDGTGLPTRPWEPGGRPRPPDHADHGVPPPRRRPPPDRRSARRPPGRHRRARTYLRRRLVALAVVVALGFLTVQGIRSLFGPEGSDAQGVAAASSPEVPGDTSGTGASSEVASARSSEPAGLPLGPETLSTVPAAADQVLIVRGEGPTSSIATVQLYQRSGDWSQVASWKGHVGRSGWSEKPHEGDLRTPVGTFTLSDAGGRKRDPGTKLPYYRSNAFVAPEDAGFGDSMASAFNYVVAVDFNRVTGRSPLDQTRPQGWNRGGGIWIHVDHNGPTHGCVSIPQNAMRALLQTLRPGEHPVVVMGDRARLRS